MSLPHSFFIGRSGGGVLTYDFTDATFAYASGANAPALQEVRSGLSGAGISAWETNTTILDVSNGIILWRVPFNGSFYFDVRGGQGGEVEGLAGRGARMQGFLSLIEGEYLKLVVGMAGQSSNAGGGGGGSFVVRASDNSPLIIAGGGGGSGSGGGQSGAEWDTLAAGQITTSGSRGSNAYDTAGAGGTNGSVGGTSPADWNGSGGAGFNNEQTGLANGGSRRANGFLYPTDPCIGGLGYQGCFGGFGGGGGGGQFGAGGGGGYSGGGNSTRHGVGGGGGSFNAGTGQENAKGFQTGNGIINIQAA